MNRSVLGVTCVKNLSPIIVTESWIQRDSDGTWLLPAFADRHCHPLFAARESASFQISEHLDVDGIVGTLASFINDNPNLPWLDVTSFDQDLPEDFTAKRLDVASRNIPIVIHSADRHSLWVNSAALSKAGLLDSAPALKEGEVVLGEDNRPMGLLREWPAMQLVLNEQPSPTLPEDISYLSSADKKLKDAGFITIADAWIDPGMFEAYLAAAETNKLDLNYDLWFRVAQGESDEQLRYLRASLERLSSPRAKVGCQTIAIAGVKIFLDGVISSKTAALEGGYIDVASPSPLWSKDSLNEMLVELAQISPDLRPHFHAIGDAAVTLALDAIETARANNIWSGAARPVIAHAELVLERDLPRFDLLDVEVVMSPQWLANSLEDDPSNAALPYSKRAVLGDFNRLTSAGALVTFGSDWPVSEPNAMAAIATGFSWLSGRNGRPESEASVRRNTAKNLEMLWRIASGPAWRNSGHRLRFDLNPLEVALSDPEELSRLTFEPVTMT